jgi:adenosylcobinamide-phosphate synthase
MYTTITLLAYLIDRLVGEFSFIKHPVSYMGDYIKWFEASYYRDSIWRGAILTVSLSCITFFIIDTINLYIGYLSNIYIQTGLYAIVASTTISSRMLYDAVKEIISSPKKIKYLVSRDTQHLAPSEINKAAIETYAENLSDGVIAPLFYLLLFGIDGAFLYKAINTLDSMVGYRNERYERFGKLSAIVDDILNYIPARITALLIALLMGSKRAIRRFYQQGKKHESPNAGHPIAAMGLALGISLGGDTSYFGKIKKKPIFGEGEEKITPQEIENALSIRWRLDLFVILLLGVALWI